MLVKLEKIEFKTFTCCIYKGEHDKETYSIFIPLDYCSSTMNYEDKIRSLKSRFIINNCDYYFYDLLLPHDFK